MSAGSRSSASSSSVGYFHTFGRGQIKADVVADLIEIEFPFDISLNFRELLPAELPEHRGVEL